MHYCRICRRELYRAGVSGISHRSCSLASFLTSAVAPCCPGFDGAVGFGAKGIIPFAENTGKSCFLLAGDMGREDVVEEGSVSVLVGSHCRGTEACGSGTCGEFLEDPQKD